MTIKVNELTYVEVIRNYTYFHTITGTYKARLPLYSAEEKLSGCSFARINNCYLVNMKHITRIIGDDAYVDQTPLKISKKRKAAFLDEYTKYIGGF